MKVRNGSRTTSLTLSEGERRALVQILTDYAQRRRQDQPVHDDDLHRAIEGEAEYAEKVIGMLNGEG